MSGDGARQAVGRLPGEGEVDRRAVRVRVAGPSRTIDDSPIVVAPAHGGAGAIVDGAPADVSLQLLDGARAIVREAAERTAVVLGPVVAAERGTARREILVGGWRIEIEIESEVRAALRERAGRGRGAAAYGGPLEIRAIIPGRVVAVFVAPGDAVDAGSQLMVVEAMKMQNELRAPRDGTITRVAVKTGQTVEIGDLLATVD